jgi:hypothetical protein
LVGHGNEGRRASLLLLLLAQVSLALSPVLASGAGLPSKQLPCRILWREAAGGVAEGGGPWNNLLVRAGSRICEINALFSLQAVRGGEDKGVPVLVCCRDWIRAGFHSAGDIHPPLFLFADGGVGDFGGKFWTLSGRHWLGMLMIVPPADDVNFLRKSSIVYCDMLLLWNFLPKHTRL